MKALTTLLVVGMFLTTVAMADDVDDIKAAEMAHFAARRAGDVGAYVQYHSPERNGFPPNGLLSSTSLEEQRENGQAEVDAGVKRNVQLRHLDVKIYGNLTAVTTGYIVGTVTQADGTVEQVATRRTVVLIKQGGQWKEVHFHVSPLFPQ